MTYFDQKEVSNSDLSWLHSVTHPSDKVIDTTAAFRFGNLLDAVITEQHRVDYFKKTLDGERCFVNEFDKAEKMKRAFYSDPYCLDFIKQASFQVVKTDRAELEYDSYKFFIQRRCKFDVLRNDNIGSDIKSTIAKKESEFIDAIKFFNYDRQTAWYMDIAKIDYMVIMGISKHNFKIFKVPINRNSDIYLSGKEKYMSLACKWNLMFGETKIWKQKILELETFLEVKNGVELGK